jgi:hypothetical protein
VTVLAHGSRYDEIREGGIIIDPMKNEHTVTCVPVVKALAPDDRYDPVF